MTWNTRTDLNNMMNGAEELECCGHCQDNIIDWLIQNKEAADTISDLAFERTLKDNPLP